MPPFATGMERWQSRPDGSARRRSLTVAPSGRGSQTGFSRGHLHLCRVRLAALGRPSTRELAAGGLGGSVSNCSSARAGESLSAASPDKSRRRSCWWQVFQRGSRNCSSSLQVLSDTNHIQHSRLSCPQTSYLKIDPNGAKTASITRTISWHFLGSRASGWGEANRPESLLK